MSTPPNIVVDTRPRNERFRGAGGGLGAAFCGVWIWAEENLSRVEEARARFDQRAG
jgi:hypothetical protein